MKTLMLGWIAWGGLADIQITIRLVNAGLIPEAVRHRAKREAAQILRSAGVTVHWAECPCPGDPGPSEFWLHVLDRPTRRSEDAAGFAVVYPPQPAQKGYAGVYYRIVKETAEREESNEATVLGAFLAHEIGHLLLNSNEHSATGVMRLRLGRGELVLAARGNLRFSSEDVVRIRALWENRARM